MWKYSFGLVNTCHNIFFYDLYCLYIYVLTLLYSKIALSMSKSQAFVYLCQIAWCICEHLLLDAHHVVEFWNVKYLLVSDFSHFYGIFGIQDFDTSPWSFPQGAW